MPPVRAQAARVLVVDDHVEMARVIADRLADAGYAVDVASGGEEGRRLALERLPDVVVTDLRMERLDGLDLLDAVKAADASVPVLVMTAFGAIDSAIAAIKRGAYHYFTKPFQLEEVVVWIERALADRRLRDEHRALQRLAAERSGFGAMVGRSPAMRALYDLVERVARSPAPVLVRGESGTGKELVARALHFEGPRRDRPFVAMNCTALPETLLESELFGHARGAFTGAVAARRGLLTEADGGTLFLDEVGDMPPSLQAKLLRVLEDGEVRPVGADAARKVDVRVIGATHQDLEARVASGAFRADLFYRLNVVAIAVPPLRARPEDVPLLIERFLAEARARNPSSPVSRLTPDAVTALAGCPWPGNVRELENVVERLVVVGRGETAGLDDLQALAPHLFGNAPVPLVGARARPLDRIMTLRQLEDEYIAWVLAQCAGSKARAAELLGIDVSTLYRREKPSR
jgi:two-component system response regulator HydG